MAGRVEELNQIRVWSPALPGVDPGTLARRERGNGSPPKRFLELIETFDFIEQ